MLSSTLYGIEEESLDYKLTVELSQFLCHYLLWLDGNTDIKLEQVMGFLDLLVVLTEVGDIYRINFFGLPPIRSYLSGSK